MSAIILGLKYFAKTLEKRFSSKYRPIEDGDIKSMLKSNVVNNYRVVWYWNTQ